MVFPVELQNMILYRYGGLEHPTARIMKPLIKWIKVGLLSCIETSDEDITDISNEMLYESWFNDGCVFESEILMRMEVDGSAQWKDVSSNVYDSEFGDDYGKWYAPITPFDW